MNPAGTDQAGAPIPMVEFEHVSFAYKGAKAESLTDIDFRAMKGETIGIIGGTGAGKSTVVNLIPRFYEDVYKRQALSDRWDKKKTMLVCDTLAALMTLIVWSLLKGGRLEIWHLYLINAVNGMANSVQQPASELSLIHI